MKTGMLPSAIHVGMSSTTLMSGSSFYDGQGRFHSHDPNTSTTNYTCSNGHSWNVGSGPILCWCQNETTRKALEKE